MKTTVTEPEEKEKKKKEMNHLLKKRVRQPSKEDR